MSPASPANNYHYNGQLKKHASANRKKMTKAAVVLWSQVLKGRNMKGYQFRRERPILNYIVDFVCLELLLIIEVDGFTHEDEQQQLRDQKRDTDLTSIGFHVLRYTNHEVLHQAEVVFASIEAAIKQQEKSCFDK